MLSVSKLEEIQAATFHSAISGIITGGRLELDSKTSSVAIAASDTSPTLLCLLTSQRQKCGLWSDGTILQGAALWGSSMHAMAGKREGRNTPKKSDRINGPPLRTPPSSPLPH